MSFTPAHRYEVGFDGMKGCQFDTCSSLSQAETMARSLQLMDPKSLIYVYDRMARHRRPNCWFLLGDTFKFLYVSAFRV